MDITDPAMFLATTAVFGPKGQGTMETACFSEKQKFVNCPDEEVEDVVVTVVLVDDVEVVEDVVVVVVP